MGDQGRAVWVNQYEKEKKGEQSIHIVFSTQGLLVYPDDRDTSSLEM
jgi:hypothetical protein